MVLMVKGDVEFGTADQMLAPSVGLPVRVKPQVLLASADLDAQVPLVAGMVADNKVCRKALLEELVEMVKT